MNTHIPDLWEGPTVRPSLSDLQYFRDRPHEFLLRLVRKHGDTVWFAAGPWRIVIGTHPRHVHHVLVEGHKVYTKSTFQYSLLSEVTGDGLLTSDGDLWRERRRILQPAFQRTRLDLVSKATLRATEAMWHRWLRNESTRIDVAAEMFRLSLDVVMDVLFGMSPGERSPALVDATVGVLDHLIHRSRMIPGLPSWAFPRRHSQFRRSLAVLDQAIGDILVRRRADGISSDDDRKDLLDLLLSAEREHRITAAGVRNEMMTMIVAGHETVASALTWCWLLLSDHPEVADRLATEAGRVSADAGLEATRALPLARNVMSESLRLYPPAWMVSRKSKPEEPSGRWLPEGTLILLSPYVTQRSAEFWPNPDEFDPSRFDNASASGSYFPFGTGPRLCIGKDFALVEAVIILAQITRRCRLRTTSSVVADHAGVTLQPESGLLVEIEPR